MIATALTFLLGVLVALLLALLLAPLLWRKAQTFARREYEATLPASANEIRAEFDMVRAEAALNVRRGEVAVSEMRQRMTAAMADLGRANGEVAGLRRRERDLETEIAKFGLERDKLRQTFSSLEDKERVLSQSLDAAKRDGSLNAEELEALAQRFREMSDLAEERKVELIAAETRIERLSDTLHAVERASVEKDTLIRLLRAEAETAQTPRPRGALKTGAIPGLHRIHSPTTRTQDKDGGPAAVLDRAWPEIGLGPDRGGGDPAERIAEIAAHAILTTARREGEASPLVPLLVADAKAAGSGQPGHFGLADRVRRLAETTGGMEDDQAPFPPRRAE